MVTAARGGGDGAVGVRTATKADRRGGGRWEEVVFERGSTVQAVRCVFKGSKSSWTHLDHRNKSGASTRLLRLKLLVPGYSATLVKIHTFVVIRCVCNGSVAIDCQEFVIG